MRVPKTEEHSKVSLNILYYL